MNLEESDKFVEQQRRTEKKKKVVLVSLVMCAILVALLIVMIIYIQYQESLKLKLFIDGQEIKYTSTTFKEENGTMYVNIKTFADLLNYTYTKGEYKKYNEDANSCYLKNNLEVVAMTAEKDTFAKYIEVVEDAVELTEEGPFGMEISVDSVNGASNMFVIEKPVKSIDNELYLPLDYVRDVYNVGMDLSTKNRIRLYTLPTLFKNALSTAERLEYTTISGVYENIRTLPYGFIVVGDNGIFGVVDATTGKEILSVKYENLEFLQNTQEFFIRAEGTVGLLDKEGKTIIQPLDYDDMSILDQVKELYLVTKDNKYGVVNREGEVVIHVDYDRIGLENIADFKIEDIRNENLLFDKCIVAEIDGAFGLYDLEGKELLEPVYDGFGYLSEVSGEDSVLIIPESVAKVQGLVINYNGLYALYDVKKEEVVLPAVYTKFYSVTKAGQTNYFVEFGEEQLNIKDVIKNLQQEEKQTDTSTETDTNTNTTTDTSTTTVPNEDSSSSEDTSQTDQPTDIEPTEPEVNEGDETTSGEEVTE